MKRTWTIIGVQTFAVASNGTSRSSASPRRLRAMTTLVRSWIRMEPSCFAFTGGAHAASLIDEPGRGVAWQRPPLVLPRRRFRRGTEEGTRSRRPVRRGTPREPEHTNKGVLTPGSGRYYSRSVRSLRPSQMRPNQTSSPTAQTAY